MAPLQQEPHGRAGYTLQPHTRGVHTVGFADPYQPRRFL